MADFQKIWEARRWASLFLKEHSREANVVDILLMHHLQLSKAQLLSVLQEEFPEEKRDIFIHQITEYGLKGVPVQHLIGYEYFYGRKFSVNRHVLIPRPETEELVQLVLQEVERRYATNRVVKCVDIGTGSGVIAVTLKKEQPSLEVAAIDISADALSVAKGNAKNHEVDIAFYEGSYLQPLIDEQEEVDVIVSNPPYIPNEDERTLVDTVKDYDPHLALFGGEDGLNSYRTIVMQSHSVLRQNGLIAFEIGYNQGQDVCQIIQAQYKDAKPKIVQDINGKDRFVYCWIQ
ncbi:peptide chain release factor N(5)-glutamine methyltransferase [Salirhabdus salicampi]|uniref:peptide chain release factor N(5)-glutamine methyltransferase n=1 Tax=Salirhabdus salicampi TaxID=476102 RepID=UPI0020C3D4F5|nr:peptide chain release factor N(5)-glutamine methyltransferase [Salirhabdus salicampi]MCP8617420.1 peptide chain release factor N(5)-glutamine methyltransferase [Salirhabdus salicampi]